MSDISLRHNHSLGIEKAKELTQKITTDVKEKYPDLIKTVEWSADGTVANLKGTGFSGVFKVEAEAMAIDIDLNFATRMFKGKIEEKIKGQISKYFG